MFTELYSLVKGRDLHWWRERAGLVASNPGLFVTRLMYNVKREVSDAGAALGYYSYPHHIIFIAGLPLSATTWVKNLLGRVPGYHTRHTPMPWLVSNNQNICDSAFRFVPARGYTLFKTHLNPTEDNLQCVTANGVDKIVVTYRDLRDVAVSRYHRLMLHPKRPKEANYCDYRAMVKEDAMDHCIEVLARDYAAWTTGWRDIAQAEPDLVYLSRFETLKKDTITQFRSILTFCGIDLPLEQIRKIVTASQGTRSISANLTRAAVLPGALGSNFRSGRVGVWREEFSQRNIDNFKRLCGQVLIDLDYEDGFGW